MAFDRGLQDLMTDRVKVFSGAPTRTVYGVESWTVAASTYPARVVNKAEMIRVADGHVREVRQVAWIGPTTSLISTGSMIELPDGTRPPIEAVEVYGDEDGYHHTKVMFGWSQRG